MRGKTLLIRIAALAVCVALAAAMMVIGRGHTLYFDNKTIEDYQGQEYKAFDKVLVTVKGEQVAKLAKRDRGMAIWIGQNFKMILEVTREKGGESEIHEIDLKLPYSVDGIVINLPALLAGLPEEAWFSEFVPAVTEEPVEEVPGEGDEFGLGLEGELGLEEGLGDI